jgi:hypothetical protein
MDVVRERLEGERNCRYLGSGNFLGEGREEKRREKVFDFSCITNNER